MALVQTTIVRDGRPFVFGDDIQAGDYGVTMLFAPFDIEPRNGVWCRNSSYLKPELREFRETAYAARLDAPDLRLATRVDLSHRMGMYYHEYKPLKLRTPLSPAMFKPRIDALPLCDEQP